MLGIVKHARDSRTTRNGALSIMIAPVPERQFPNPSDRK